MSLDKTESHAPHSEDSVDLLDYWRIIWNRKWLLIIVIIIASVAGAGYSLTLPNIYRASVIASPMGEKAKDPRGRLARFAALAGVGASESGVSLDEKLVIVRSRQFLLDFVSEFKLKPLLFSDKWDFEKGAWKGGGEPGDWAVYRKISKALKVSPDKDTGLIIFSVIWSDGKIAAKVANDLVAYLNHHLQSIEIERCNQRLGYLQQELQSVQIAEMRQVLFELIAQQQKNAMIASTKGDYAFWILSPAVAPDVKYKPERAKITIIWGVVAGFLALILIFIQEAIRRPKNDKF